MVRAKILRSLGGSAANGESHVGVFTLGWYLGFLGGF